MSEIDRRIQLRESIHQLVVSAASNRCVTPAAFISMVVYEYLQSRSELTAVSEVSSKPPLHPTPAKPTPTPAPKPKPKPSIYSAYQPDEGEIAYVKEQFAKMDAKMEAERNRPRARPLPISPATITSGA